MDKLANAIYGVAIGDAMGLPYEFEKRGTFECTCMTGYGAYNQPAGTFSDDTSMTLATLDSLKANGGKVDIEDMRKRFMLWYRAGYYTCDGRAFDVGSTTSTALDAGAGMTHYKSNGNGSLMRILPLAFTDAAPREIMDVSGITHGHEISLMACVIYVQIARRLLKGERIEDIVPKHKHAEPFDRLYRIGELDEAEIESDGFVVHTLEAALWTLLNTDNFDDAILTAVNLGADTDTTAAVVGGLAGIIYGVNEEWKSQLRGQDVLEGVLTAG